MKTPVTPSGLRRYDQLPPEEAIVQAWTRPGRKPDWHRRMQEEVGAAMPLLARAIRRLVDERRGVE